MKFNKYLIISLILLLIILSLYFINYLFRDQSKNFKNNSLEKNKIINESFSNNIDSNIEDSLINSKNEYNNLIVNGNFENGRDSPNHVNQSGYNKIVMIKNPGQSSYALEQKKTDTLTYYEFIRFIHGFICYKNSQQNFKIGARNKNVNSCYHEFSKH
jgi:hypothetical protein